MTKRITGLAAALCACASFSAAAAQEASLDDLAFLEGHWRGGGDGFTFEETWHGAEAGVMTGMARGISDGEIRVLEYVIISEDADGLVLRYKHYTPDYSTWEQDGPIVLPLTAAGENDVTFSADPPSQSVKSIRFRMTDADTLQADVGLIQDGEKSGLTIVLQRAEK